MALKYNWPLVPFHFPDSFQSAPRVPDDEDKRSEEMERIVGQVVDDLIRTGSLKSQEHSHNVCNGILLDFLGLMFANTDVMENDAKDNSEQTSPEPQEDCSEVDEEPGQLCQEVIMSLVAEAVKDPKLICKDILSEFVESILTEKSNQTSNKTPTVALKILNALDNLYK